MQIRISEQLLTRLKRLAASNHRKSLFEYCRLLSAELDKLSTFPKTTDEKELRIIHIARRAAIDILQENLIDFLERLNNNAPTKTEGEEYE